MKNFNFAQLKICSVALVLWLLNYSFAVTAEILIFVSFSMPTSALQSYYLEGSDAKLVMRGLYKDSFEATRLKVESIGIAYDIDPELFEKYQVVTVPTIVKVEGDSWQKVAGHITLAAALEIFAGK